MTVNNRPSAIDVRGLDKRFGPIHAVRNVSFSVQHGEALGFLGPNGAGKSTTMKMITSFLEPTGGTALVNGHDVKTDPISVKSAIGYLPEGAPAYGEMTALRFLEFVAEIRGLGGADKQERFGKVIELVHLDNVLDQTVEILSKGFKRRLIVITAFISHHYMATKRQTKKTG